MTAGRDSLMSREAFEGLVREHQNMVYSIALTYCRDPHAAEDIRQEAFIRAHKAINGLTDRSRLKMN